MKRLLRPVLTVFGLTLLLIACAPDPDARVREADAFLETLRDSLVPDSRMFPWNVNVTYESDTINLFGYIGDKQVYKTFVQRIDETYPQWRNRVDLVPAQEPERLIHAVAVNAVGHMRAQPSHRAEIVTQAIFGHPLRVFREQDGWFLVQTPNGYHGWLDGAALCVLDREAMDAYRALPKVVFSAQTGTVWSEPNEKSLPVSDLVAGAILATGEPRGAFLQVLYPDGRNGWVRQSDCLPWAEWMGRTPAAAGVLASAMPYNGIPYLWGGTSSKGIDCSGFASMVYLMNGLVLLRDADQQSRCEEELSTAYAWDGLEAGDLLFFGRPATEEQAERVTHVAIYISDSGIHPCLGPGEDQQHGPGRENFLEEYRNCSCARCASGPDHPRHYPGRERPTFTADFAPLTP
ncbi:MAG: NlpC/P60 family protein [Bacteroidales bacterium]